MNVLKNILINIKFSYLNHISWQPKINVILDQILFPIVQAFFFVYVANTIYDEPGIKYYIIGNLSFMVMDCCLGGTSVYVAMERSYGTLNSLLSSAINNIWSFIARSLYWMFSGYVRMVSTIVGLSLIFGRPVLTVREFILFSLMFFVIGSSTMGLGLSLGILGFVYRNVMTIVNIVKTLLLLVSGVYYSVDILPGFLRTFSYVSPLTYGIKSTRILLEAGIGVNFFVNLLLTLLVGSMYFVISLFVYREIESRSIRDGAWGHY